MVDAGSKRTETLSKEDAHAKLISMGTSVLFEKVLTTSDANGSGRIVIPKSQAEAHFPEIDAQTGIPLNIFDTYNKKHQLRYRFWINNASRMYLLENTQDVIERYGLGVGDVLIFSQNPDGQYYVCGRKGTKEDVSRKTATKRLTESMASRRGSKVVKSSMQQPTPKVSTRVAPASKRMRVKQEIGGALPATTAATWSGYSSPPRQDGVFRAMLPGSTAKMNQVAPQHGCWTAIVDLCGEPFQAFFETREAASDALEAALFVEDGPYVAADGSPGGPGARVPSGPLPLAATSRRASLGQLADAAALVPGLHSLAAAAGV